MSGQLRVNIITDEAGTGSPDFVNGVRVAGVTQTQAFTGSTIVQMTAQASTSGTSIPFTGIPAGVKRITVMLAGVSTNGSSNLLVQLGTSGGFVTSGYSSGSTSGGGSPVFSSSGLLLTSTNGSGNSTFGLYTICALGDDSFSAHGGFRVNASNAPLTSSGGVSLGAAITSLRLTTVNGTDTFDAGTVNVLYEL